MNHYMKYCSSAVIFLHSEKNGKALFWNDGGCLSSTELHYLLCIFLRFCYCIVICCPDDHHASLLCPVPGIELEEPDSKGVSECVPPTPQSSALRAAVFGQADV